MASRIRLHVDQILTVGVEEEFLLVDRATRVTAPRALEVLDLAAADLAGRVDHELYSCQVEAQTRPAATAAVLRADLVEGRRVLSAAAARAGCLLVASGSAVLTSAPLGVTEDPRYELMVARYGASVAAIDSESSGCHVHLGELTLEEAVLLGGHLRPWLPVLQALAANAPFAAGRRRPCASWRYFQLQNWPTNGPAPLIGPSAYERMARDLVDSGALLDRKMIYWYTRPSEAFPTLEIRVPDVNADVDVDLLVAMLTRALGTRLLAELRRGAPRPEVADGEIREAHRQAGAHGLGGHWIHPVTRRAMPLAAALRQLFDVAAPVLDMIGETQLARQLLHRVARRGTGDQQQRAAFRMRRSLADFFNDSALGTVMP